MGVGLAIYRPYLLYIGNMCLLCGHGSEAKYHRPYYFPIMPIYCFLKVCDIHNLWILYEK